MIKKAIEGIGEKVVANYRDLHDLVVFAVSCIFFLVTPSSYDRATRKVLIRQVYFTSVQILPFFLTLCFVFGSITIGAAMGAVKQMGLFDMLGEMVFGLVITEIAPLLTVILISLRSSSAMNTEIAVMNVNNELDTLRAFGIDEKRYLAMPRIINAVVSIVMLSYLFAFISVLSGSFFSLLFFGTGFELYLNILAKSISLGDIGILLFKSVAFGLAVSIIPIYSGLLASKQMTGIPISVLKGMVRIFNAIIFIEVASLALKAI